MLFEILNVAVGTPSKMFAHFNRSMSNFFYFIPRNDREHLKTVPALLDSPPSPRQAPGAAQHPGSSLPLPARGHDGMEPWRAGRMLLPLSMLLATSHGAERVDAPV